MNPNQQPQKHNPYLATPQPYTTHPGTAQHPGTVQSSANPPLFCLIMFIVSLVFSVLRILFVALGILGYIMMADMVNPPAGFALAIPELLAGVGIIIFGLLGNSLMLARKKIGVTLGAVLVFFVLASTVIGGLQGAAYLSNYNSGSPEWMGAIFGVVFTLIIRVAILIAYVFALLKFNKWLGKQTPTANV